MIRPIVEPKPCTAPIRHHWRTEKPPGLGRAVSNIVVQRLRPDLTGTMAWPLETSAMGSRQLCFIYPAVPPMGHWFGLSRKACRDIAEAAAEQAVRPLQDRAEIVLLAAWRSQSYDPADRRLDVWAIPAGAVAEMDRQVSADGINNRNVLIAWVGTQPLWRKGQHGGLHAGPPISLGAHYCRWSLSDAELAYVAGERGDEEPIRRPRE
jgi:hypothetical protein